MNHAHNLINQLKLQSGHFLINLSNHNFFSEIIDLINELVNSLLIKSSIINIREPPPEIKRYWIGPPDQLH